MRGVGRAWGVGLGLERMQAPTAHGRAQALAAHPVLVFMQRDLQPAGAITALVDPKGLDQGRSPSRRLRIHRPLLPRLPRIVPTGRHPEHLAEPPHGAMPTFGGDETVAAHGSGVWESLRMKQALAMAMAFFKISSSCACRRLAARSWRSSAAVVGSSAAPKAAATGVWAAFCHW